MQGAHTRLLIALLLVMTVVVLTAHLVLKRQLRPLRDLSEVCSVYRFNRCFTGACLVPQSASCAATFGG